MTRARYVTRVKELMTFYPEMIRPDTTLQEAAKKMESNNCGALPIGDEHRLQGIITDRDIVVRALAYGKNPAIEKVGDYMTTPVYTCNEDDTLEEAAESMYLNRVSRLVVQNKTGKVTGILFFGRILRNDADAKEIVSVLKHCCCPIAV